MKPRDTLLNSDQLIRVDFYDETFRKLVDFLAARTCPAEFSENVPDCKQRNGKKTSSKNGICRTCIALWLMEMPKKLEEKPE